jgi:uncharacterized phage protein gp47/JayE
LPLFAESSEKIFGDLLIEIIENTPLTKTSVGSKTRAISEALSGKLGQMYRKFDANMVQAFLTGAEGQFLDFIGDMMGVERLGQEVSNVASSERILKFYVDSGTFGDINGGNSILLSSGTNTGTAAAGTGVTYTIPYNIILSSSLSEVYVAARAVRPGTSGNIGARQLIYHNFTNYTDSGNDSLKVINEAEIVKGRDGEIDTNYKFRISKQVTAAEKANLTAVRLAVLETPGVADLVAIPYFRGIGTFDILLKSTTPTVSTGLISAVNEAVRKVMAQGIIPTIRGPVEIGISLTGKLTLKKRMTAAEETNILNAVTGNVRDYINSLDIDEDMIVNELIERVMATSSEIKNVGTATKPFESIYTYKPTRLEDNKIRGVLLTDYTAEEDERVIVEDQYAGSTPILFTIAS